MKKIVVVLALVLAASPAFAQRRGRGVTNRDLVKKPHTFEARQTFEAIAVPPCPQDPPTDACLGDVSLCVDDTNQNLYGCLAGTWTSLGAVGTGSEFVRSDVDDQVDGDLTFPSATPIIFNRGAGIALQFSDTSPVANPIFEVLPQPISGGSSAGVVKFRFATPSRDVLAMFEMDDTTDDLSLVMTGGGDVTIQGGVDDLILSAPGDRVVVASELELHANFADMDPQGTPADPPSGTRRLFVDSGSGELSVRTSGSTTVSLEAGAGGGEANTGSNQGTDGVGVFDTKVSVDLQFRHVAPGSSKVTTVLNGKDIDVDVVEANLTLDSLGGTLGIAKGGTGQTAADEAFDALAPATTEGDLLCYDAGVGDTIRLGVGIDDQVLTADAAQTCGMKWADAVAGGAHVLADGTGLGPLHTMSGAAAGEVLRALSATTAAFDVLARSDLSGTTSIAEGGTGQTTATEAFDALAPIGQDGSLLAWDNLAGDWIEIVGGTMVNGTVIVVDGPTAGEWKQGGLVDIKGTLALAQGGTGETTATPAFDALAPTTTKGDVIAHNGSDNVRLAAGTNDWVLTADSTAAAGVEWRAAPGGSSIAMLGFSGGSVTVAKGVTAYTMTGGMAPTTQAEAEIMVRFSGGGTRTLRDLGVYVQTNDTGAAGNEIRLMRGGATTGVLVTYGSGETGLKEDNVNTFGVSNGQKLSFRIVNTGSGGGTKDLIITGIWIWLE